MLSVEATMPPTSTRLPWPNSTPLGLISHTCPLAFSLPSIQLLTPLVTRFRAMALLSGCWKVTLASRPISKRVQSMMALLLPWFTVMALPLWPMLAVPETTLPPVGKAPASSGAAQPGRLRTAPRMTAAGANALDLDLPLPLAHSGAGT